MNGEEFTLWLTAMKARGVNKGACAGLLGRGAQWVTYAQSHGTDRVTALACAAILIELEPFSAATVVPAKLSRRRSAHPSHA